MLFCIPKKVTVALETFRNPTGSPDPNYHVVGNDAVLSKQKSCLC